MKRTSVDMPPGVTATPLPETRLVSLLTDFGVRDNFVGLMKAAVFERSPQAVMVDLTHEIPPQDLSRAAFVLWSAVPHLPSGTVNLVVVDPGVGGKRRALAGRAGEQVFVGPDNGVLIPAMERLGRPHLFSLEDSRFFAPQMSATFHGRDIFAPVAGHLAAGATLEEIGIPCPDPVRLEFPRWRMVGVEIRGEVITTDHYGNLITSVDAEALLKAPPTALVRVGATDVGMIRSTFGDVDVGSPVAYRGSTGLLEIAVRNGSAESVLHAGTGTPVVVVGDSVDSAE